MTRANTEALGGPAASRFHPQLIATIVILALILAVPLALANPFIYYVFITICLYAALATAWNIVGGFAGQLSLGHAIFYGIGAYAGGILAADGISPWFAMPLGAAVSAMVAVAISYPCFRLKGPFFALATIAFLQVIRLLATHFSGLTGGAVGVLVPLRIGWEWMIFRDARLSLLLAFGLLVLCLGVAAWLRGHRLGFYLIAGRERDQAAQAAGVNTVKVRLLAVILSAALTSLVGTYHAMYLTYIDPESVFSLTFSIQITMFALIGGIGTVLGPLLGTLLVVPLTELARGWLGTAAMGLHGFVYGTALVLVVLFMPDGIMGFLRQRFSRQPAVAGRIGEIGQDVEALPEGPTASRPPLGQPILVVEGLEKRFGGLRVTDKISFDLKEGEVLGIIGPNGAGKTTLFNMLSGVLKPEAGLVRIRAAEGGALITPGSPHEFARAGVGRTFQIVQPFAAMTVLENIMVGAFYRHPERAAAQEKAETVAAAMGLWHLRDLEARNLTIGGLKRLEVARVMAMEPRILLLDEVMAGLNQTDVRRAIELMRRIRDQGVSIIAIEHVMQAIMALSDRVLVINAGRIVAAGKPEDVVRDPQVIEAYLGKEFTHAPA